MSQTPPQYSADGKFYWNGTQWIPVGAPPAPPPVRTSGGGWGRTIAVGVVCLVVGAICGGAVASSGRPSTSASNSNSSPEASPVPSPSPSPRQPVSVSGKGSKVITPLHLGEGNYKVSWTAQGHDNFIVHIRLGSDEEFLVNEIPPSPASGETLFESPQDADYTLEIQASTLTWRITFTPI